MTDQLTPEGIAACRELLTMYAELSAIEAMVIRPEIEAFLFGHAEEFLDTFERHVRQSAVVSDLIGNVTHLDSLLGLTEVPEVCPEYAPDGYAAELERVVSVLVEHDEDMRQPGQTVHDVVAGVLTEALDIRKERAALVELLAGALGFGRLLDSKPSALRFLVEELIEAHDRIKAAFIEDHGGAPAQGLVGDQWHLFWQFRSDVWNELSPEHKLYLRVVTVNRNAAADFVAELRNWIAFIERSVLEEAPTP